MNSFLSALKDQASILNGLIFLFLAAFIFWKFGKRKVAVALIIFDAILFWSCATSYLPKYLARKLERHYPAFDVKRIKAIPGNIYIHVLGSGYSLDSSLQANSRLGTVAQCRLVEAFRLYRLIDKSILVCSGGSPANTETQAEVTRKAAMLLGVDSSRIKMLQTPLTTMEEAKALAGKIDTSAAVIIVTDAIHMPRAMKFFTHQGFKPFAAPANYRAPVEKQQKSMKWWPSLNNLLLMDIVLHEYLGDLKEKW